MSLLSPSPTGGAATLFEAEQFATTLAFNPELVLRLSLSGSPFAVMVTGEKPYEYRKPSNWILSRLLDSGRPHSPRSYEYVLFINGYGGHRPWFAAEFLGWHLAEEQESHTYSNYLKVEVRPGDVIIRLGKVVASGNLGAGPTPEAERGGQQDA